MNLKTLFIVLVVGGGLIAGFGVTQPRKPITVFMPDAGQGSQPLCISNRTQTSVEIPKGVTLKPGESTLASVVNDYQWGFTQPKNTTDRTDVDCLVIQ